MTFKIGDRVTINAPRTAWHGEVGTIYDIRGVDGVIVHFGYGRATGARLDAFYRVDELIPADPVTKLGDLVAGA